MVFITREKKMITAICKSIRGLWVLLLILFATVSVAKNIVVVVPLAGEDAISHPVAKTFTNSIGMQFNELPAGSFTMGSPSGEPGRNADEVEHTVTLSKAFRMQVTEVTNAQWNDVIVDSALGINPSIIHPGDNTYPVEFVNWYDAVFFANRLSFDEGLSDCYTFSGVSGTAGSNLTITTVTQNANCTGYRLPTEAEWEYAARAGTTKAYANPIGFDDSDVETGSGFNGNLNAMGWYEYNNEIENSSAVAAYEDGNKPVTKKQANAWGLYDMHGNVYELIWDWYSDYSGNVTDPNGPASGIARVIRGGSGNSLASSARSASRLNAALPSSRFSDLGFRLVLSQGQ